MKTLKNETQTKSGFTLVELLVVIAIIAILSVTAYVALGGQTGKARDARRQQDLGSIQQALELYAISNANQYPTTLTDLTAKEMPTLPLDPSSNEIYAYKTNLTKKRYQLGATLEGDGDTYTAYVIGNSETDIITPGVDVLGTKGCQGASPANGDTNCVPMDIWN